MKFSNSLQIMNQNLKYANQQVCFLHNSLNPSKNYFQHAVAKYQVLTAVPSKKYCNSVKMSNIFKNVPESSDSCKTSIEQNNSTEWKNLKNSIMVWAKTVTESCLLNFKCCWLPPSAWLPIGFLTFVFQLLFCFNAGVLFKASVSKLQAFLNYKLSFLASFNNGKFSELLSIYVTAGLPHVFFLFEFQCFSFALLVSFLYFKQNFACFLFLIKTLFIVF